MSTKTQTCIQTITQSDTGTAKIPLTNITPGQYAVAIMNTNDSSIFGVSGIFMISN